MCNLRPQDSVSQNNFFHLLGLKFLPCKRSSLQKDTVKLYMCDTGDVRRPHVPSHFLPNFQETLFYQSPPLHSWNLTFLLASYIQHLNTFMTLLPLVKGGNSSQFCISLQLPCHLTFSQSNIIFYSLLHPWQPDFLHYFYSQGNQ